MNLPDTSAIAVVIPVFNDWSSCGRLVSELDRLAADLENVNIDLFIVDDGSTSGPGPDELNTAQLEHLERVHLTTLRCNLGHQRAIAAGLYTALQQPRYHSIVVMDADGEDAPQDVASLIEKQTRLNVPIVVAQRSRRSEGLMFRVFYRLYKILYRALTGSEISFGNFSIVSRQAAQRLIHMPELWNNYPSAILQSGLPIDSIPTMRGKRYFGESRMNLAGLIIHGLGAISVSSEIVFARIIIFTLMIASLSVLGGVIVAAIRLFTDLAIPGWASGIVGNLAVILTQTVFFFFISMFLLLRARSAPALPPGQVIPAYISDTRELFANGQ
jgi:hypothetical protein